MASDQFLSLHGRRQQLVAISADRRRSAPERFIYFTQLPQRAASRKNKSVLGRMHKIIAALDHQRWQIWCIAIFQRQPWPIEVRSELLAR